MIKGREAVTDMYYLHHACVSRHEEREESHVFPPSMDDRLKCTLIRCTEHLLKVRFIIPVYNTNPPRLKGNIKTLCAHPCY